MFPYNTVERFQRCTGLIMRYNKTVWHSEQKKKSPISSRNPGIEDITDKYIVCKDIKVPLWDNKHKKEYVYLCCYDDNNWIPVCWSIPRKKQALFTKVGVNVLYLPAYYENGAIIPAGDAFILKEDGELKYFSQKASKNETSATFYSKMPYRQHTALQAAGTIGTRFSICNKKDLSDSLNVYTIEKLPFYEDSFKIPDKQEIPLFGLRFSKHSGFPRCLFHCRNKDFRKKPATVGREADRNKRNK